MEENGANASCMCCLRNLKRYRVFQDRERHDSVRSDAMHLMEHVLMYCHI